MSFEQREFEELEAYVEGRLDEARQRAFEARLETDSELADQLAKYRVARKAVVGHFQDEYVRELMKEAEYRATRQRRWVWYQAAAAVVALSLGLAAWLHFSGPDNLQKLAAQYSIEEPALPVYMAETQHPMVHMDQAMQVYASGSYSDALELLRELPSTDTTRFFMGICEARMGMDPTATFGSVAQDPDSPYYAKALYHLMILAMREEHAADAEDLWKSQMALEYHPYREELVQIGEKMEWTP